MLLRLRRLHGLGQGDFLPRLQGGQPGRSDFEGAEFFGVLVKQSQPDQLAADGTPLRPGMLPADVVRGKLVMAEFADLFRVRPGEHLDHMVQAHAKAALLPDPIDAGEDFLRRRGAVPGRPGGKTVVAAAAVHRPDCLRRGRPGIRPGIPFPEIAEQKLPPAAGDLRVMDHLLKLRPRDVPLLRIRFLVNEPHLFHPVPGAEQ